MMTLHSLTCRTNMALIEGKQYYEDERDEITRYILSNVSNTETVKKFHLSVKSPNDGRIMYPLFYIPPYNNGKKLYTQNGVLPKTHIYAANSYELEALRLLGLFSPENVEVRKMLHKTMKRLKTTCFGEYCAVGECFETSIVTLRFLATAFPYEKAWILHLLSHIINDIDNKRSSGKCQSGLMYYYWNTLSEMVFEESACEIKRYKDLLVEKLCRGFSLKSEKDKMYNPTAAYIIRNCLARLPEYEDMRELKGYIAEDSRYHIDSHPQISLFV